MKLSHFLAVGLLLCLTIGCRDSIFDDVDDEIVVDDENGNDDNNGNDDGNGNGDGDGGTSTMDPFVFAVIGDYGNNSDEEGEVAELVKSWSPEFVITLGDNNYSDGELETIEENIGQYYCEFIYNPDAPEDLRCNGPAAQEEVNRFFPSLGNHDVREENGEPYLQYFTLPGNERNYDFEWGPIQFFVIDSTPEDEDLECCDSDQAIWLREGLENSNAAFKLVYFHHSPYSTGDHGSDEDMQWPFEEWGAHAVMSGHEHIYQRIHKKTNLDFPYFVCGVSGKSDEDCGKEDLEDEDDFNVLCIDGVHGAMKVLVTENDLTFQFLTIEEPGEVMDEFVLSRVD